MAPTMQDAAQIPKLDEQKKLVRTEIGEPVNIPATKIKHFLSHYQHIAKDADFKRYFVKTAFYQNRTWKIPREDGTKENDLYGPTREIIDDVMSHFHQSANRKAFVSSGKRFYHQDNPETDLYSCPDLTIQGNGPSFEYPRRAPDRDPSLGYSNTTGCIEIKLDENMGSLAGDVPQVGIYARQMFIQQPNRRFVRTLVVSQNRAGVIHYDRSGAQYTDLIDINKKPRDFIRLILGISSPDERLLGFDSTIQWAMGPDGRKESGTLTTKDAAGHEVEYDLVVPRPIFNRHSIRGRGTICWAIRDSGGNEFIVKDSWRSEGRQSEAKFLKIAKGLKGVVQMFSCEEDREETASFRGPITNVADAAQNFDNRWSTRVVLQCYGPPIVYFTSRRHAISALRDAIAGHRNLIQQEQRIIHRDISIFNILLGNPGAPKGSRGFLIDFDRAFLWDFNLSADCSVGTRLFQSVMVLRTGDHNIQANHDYLDDLESIFYVLCYLMFSFSGAGDQATAIRRGKKLDSWDVSDTSSAADSKISFMARRIPVEVCVAPYWGKACVSLLIDFKSLLAPIVHEKGQIFEGELTREEKKQRIEDLHGKMDEHYDTVLGLFDKAIELLPYHDPALEDAEAPDTTSAGPADGSPLPTDSRRAKSTTRLDAKRVPIAKRSSQKLEEPEESPVNHPGTRRSKRLKAGAAKPSPLSQSQSKSTAQ